MTAETRLPVSAYQAEVSKTVYHEMARHSQLVLAQGGSVVADAVFDDRANRRLMEATALTTGKRFQGIWLEADPQLLRQRVNARSGGPSDATTEVLAMQLARKYEDIEWREVGASLPVNQIIQDILISTL